MMKRGTFFVAVLGAMLGAALTAAQASAPAKAEFSLTRVLDTGKKTGIRIVCDEGKTRCTGERFADGEVEKSVSLARQKVEHGIRKALADLGAKADGAKAEPQRTTLLWSVSLGKQGKSGTAGLNPTRHAPEPILQLEALASDLIGRSE